MGRSKEKQKDNNNHEKKSRSHKRTEETILPPHPSDLTADSVYDFYVKNLFPAIWASLPLLFSRLGSDLMELLRVGGRKTLHFLLPNTATNRDLWTMQPATEKIKELWEHALAGTSNSSFSDFMMRNFDDNHDGHISAAELLKMNEVLLPALHNLNNAPQTWVSWFNRTWPLIDWKVGVFLWRTCGGLLLLIAAASIVPGRLHGITGRLLRWPILGLTNFMIGVELVVYVIIRLFIRLVETVFATSKHRSLRRKMAQATSYEEWYETAKALDVSQGRDKWQCRVDDDSSYRYNWSFIKELMSDMRDARTRNDSIMGLAVLQQCTRKNVGGIMSEEQFTYTYTGEPKHIVEEFVNEVVITLKWVTEEACKIPEVTQDKEEIVDEDLAYEERLRKKSQQEKNKIWASVVSWATLSFAKQPELPAVKASNVKAVKSLEQMSKPSSIKAVKSLGDMQQPPVSGSSSVDSSSPAATLPAIHREKVITFLKRARAAYGRTALCLSGGSMMGNYHFGHVKALMEEDCLPHIISGTSAGSVVAALICTRTDEEIERDMRPEVLVNKLRCFSRPWPDRIKSVWKTGNMFETQQWIDMIQWFTCGSLTFEEAYRKTGRVFCITLSATTKKAPPVLLNYISAPNVVIASAVIASAAVPGFIPPVLLQVKDSDGVVRNQEANKDQLYWDGSIEQDIPTAGLAEMLNCHFFVAAQTNPHIVPFFFDRKGAVGKPSRWSSGDEGHSWRGGFLLSALELYLKSDMRAKFHFLNDLEAAVGFTSTMMTQQYEGTTTIVPQVSLVDYFKLFVNPSLKDLYRYFQAGSVAAYQHCAMIKEHYQIAHALDDCLARLELQDVGTVISRRRIQMLAQQLKSLDQLDGKKARRHSWGCGDSETESVSCEDDEYERGGFDGVDIAYNPTRRNTIAAEGHFSPSRKRTMSDN